MFSIDLEVFVQSDSKTVYKAITEQNHLQKWFAPQVIITPKVNTYGAFAFEFDLAFKILIKKIEPYNYIQWEITDGIDDWVNTSTSFTISEENNQVLLKFRHSGLTNTLKKDQWEKSWSEFIHKLSVYCQSLKD
ncbi:MAG: SRPBCC domain-containing protein [Bacteroidales bacterium]|nr:SRPBCC domain-containing protein [Bacteroidales bacterium]